MILRKEQEFRECLGSHQQESWLPVTIGKPAGFRECSGSFHNKSWFTVTIAWKQRGFSGMAGRAVGVVRIFPPDGGNSREGSSVGLGNSLVRLTPGLQPRARAAGSGPGPSICWEGWEPWDASRNVAPLEAAPPSSLSPALPESPRGEEPRLPHPNFFLWKKLRSKGKCPIPLTAGTHGSRSRGYFGRGLGHPVGSSRWNGNSAAGEENRGTNKSALIPTPSYSHSVPRTGETFPKAPSSGASGISRDQSSHSAGKGGGFQGPLSAEIKPVRDWSSKQIPKFQTPALQQKPEIPGFSSRSQAAGISRNANIWDV